MTGPEAAIERKFMRDVRDKLGIIASKLGVDGMPDDVLWLPGSPMLIEFKRPGEQPTRRQWYWIEIFRSLGYDAQFFDDGERAFEYVKKEVERRLGRSIE